MASRHMERCSASLVVRAMPVRAAARCHLAPVRMAVVRKSASNSTCWRGRGGAGASCTVGGTADRCRACGGRWRLLNKRKMDMCYGPAISLLGIYPKKRKNTDSTIYVHRGAPRGTIFTMAKTCLQTSGLPLSRCPPVPAAAKLPWLVAPPGGRCGRSDCFPGSTCSCPRGLAPFLPRVLFPSSFPSHLCRSY